MTVATAPAEAPSSWDEVIERFETFARTTESVRGLVVVGSRTRSDRRADDWSDLDLLLVTDDRESTILDDTWLETIGPVWASLVHPGPFTDAPVRQVVFAGAFDVDLVGLTPERVAAAHADEMVKDLLARGHRVLVDKDDVLGSLPSPGAASTPRLPAAEDFLWVINDLSMQFVWASKHLRRGDLWQAKDDVDCYMRNRVLSLIEWHTLAQGRQSATWRGSASGGRMIERWADPRVLDALPATFASYSPAGVAHALVNLQALVGWIGPEIAETISVEYPRDEHDALAGWLQETLAPLLE